MSEKTRITISVRALVELLRTGDIAAGGPGARGIEGIKSHQAVQRRREERRPAGTVYTAEVPLTWSVERGDVILEVGGRADGILTGGPVPVIEEIKTVLHDPAAAARERNPLHWSQAKCYAAIYAAQHGCAAVEIELTYFQLGSREMSSAREIFYADELRVFFDGLIDQYLAWAGMLRDWVRLRDLTIRELPFPFGAYRAGQQELADAVTEAIGAGGRLFVQAPTGIGKTMATLFPAVKSLADGTASKLFYLTAKTSTRAVAEQAVDQLRQAGLRLKTITLTAREKICFQPGAECDPSACEFARGYYDRLRGALQDILVLDAFPRPVIEAYARRHRLCPFEFGLDLSLVADCIICDYNYVFDPRVYLRRFFDDEANDDYGDYVFLIDEAHNLVDRAREMFSAELRKKDVLALRRQLATAFGGRRKLPLGVKALDEFLGGINTFMLAARRACEDAAIEGQGPGISVEKKAPEDLFPALRDAAAAAEELLRREEPYPFRDALLEFYFAARGFLRTADYFDERYVSYFMQQGSDVAVKLFCIDPARLLQAALARGRAAVFFSATLSPLDYFTGILGGGEDAERLVLPSPFPRENRCLMVDDSISTTYRMREYTYDQVARAIAATAAGRKGNYLVFFPSYRYLREVYALFLCLWWVF
jgi:DNA excision repair protein ERCC-2